MPYLTWVAAFLVWLAVDIRHHRVGTKGRRRVKGPEVYGVPGLNKGARVSLVRCVVSTRHLHIQYRMRTAQTLLLG